MRLPLRTTLSLSVAIAVLFIGTTTYAAATRSVNTTRTPQSSSTATVKVTEAALPRPPVCMGVDEALRFDGKAWKCETISGLLVGYASGTYWPGNIVGTSKCDDGTAWGAGSCKKISEKSALLMCTPTTHKIELWTPSTDMGGNPIKNMYVFCYSKRITVK